MFRSLTLSRRVCAQVYACETYQSPYGAIFNYSLVALLGGSAALILYALVAAWLVVAMWVSNVADELDEVPPRCAAGATLSHAALMALVTAFFAVNYVIVSLCRVLRVLSPSSSQMPSPRVNWFYMIPRYVACLRDHPPPHTLSSPCV